MRHLTRIVSVSLVLLAAASVSAQQVYVYPQKGQTPPQQQADEGECMGWARNRTGFDPMRGPSVGRVETGGQGEIVGGAARGAAMGAVVGAIAGDAGKGAAAGAAAGGLFGGMRRNDRMRQQSHQQDQQMAQYEAAKQEYVRAYAACLEGRGYTVR